MCLKISQTLAFACIFSTATLTYAQDKPFSLGEDIRDGANIHRSRIQYSDYINPMVQWCDELFDRPETAQELGILDYQKDKIQSLLEQRIQWFRDEGPKYENNKSKFDQMVMDRTIEDAKKVLLPHQWTKLEQMAFADAKDQLGVSGMLSIKWFRERVGVNEDDVKRLKDRAEKEKVKLEEGIAKLRKEAEKNVLDELNDEQREKLKAVFGG